MTAVSSSRSEVSRLDSSSRRRCSLRWSRRVSQRPMDAPKNAGKKMRSAMNEPPAMISMKKLDSLIP
ncbi:Uncharacterised protein [Mycobacteroides abscessus subsp. abscessus]|nr:Uncharacterised protein [Mycobacteroides abscessus subsp. abscessus]